jgi:hypothetical protein
MLTGTILGVFFNAVAPGWLITILLVGDLKEKSFNLKLSGYEVYCTNPLL